MRCIHDCRNRWHRHHPLFRQPADGAGSAGSLVGVLVLLLLLSPVQALGATEAPVIDVLYMVQSGYQPDALLERTQEYRRHSPNRVRLHFVEYKDLWEGIQRGIHHGAYDVVLTDVIWTHRLVSEGALLPVPPPLARTIRERMVPQVARTFELEGELWAFPFFMDFQLLFSNRMILDAAGFSHPPRSLEELTRMARAIRDRGILPYPIFFSLAREEILMCKVLIWTGAFGGDLAPFGEGDRIRVDTPEAVQAVSWLQELLREGLLNPYSLASDEVFAAEVFLAEDAAFTTNWVFLLGKIQESAGPVARAGVPSAIPVASARAGEGPGGGQTTVNGFQGFSVLASSNHPEAAWDYVAFLSEIDFHQKNPFELAPWKGVWEDRTEGDPYFALKVEQLSALRDRPYHRKYLEISEIFQRWVHRVLRLEMDPLQGLEAAQAEIEELLEGVSP